MITLEELGTWFIAWKSGTDLGIFFSDDKLRPAVRPTHRTTGHWAFVMFAPPRTWFQTRRTGDGAKFRTLVMDAALAAGLLAFAIAPFVLGVARTPAKMLAIQRALATVLCVV